MAKDITDENHIDDMIRRLKRADGMEVNVGIFGGAKSKVAQYMSANEFGARIKVTEKARKYLHAIGLHLKRGTKTIVIPERSWFRSTLDDKSKMKKALKAFDKVTDMKFSLRKMFNLVGMELRGELRKKVRSNIQPENHPFTISRKRSSRTLVDKGIGINAIDYEVKNA
jgi:hypothetical protein